MEMAATTPHSTSLPGTTSPGPTDSEVPPFLDSDFRYLLFPVVYGIVFILGLVANIYVLFVVRRLREAKSMGEIRIYMTNLTIADLLFVCALPPWIGYYSRHGNWVYSDGLCRLTGSLFFINTYCSILFLGAISLNRYWAVTRPLDAASSDHRLRGIIVCIVIWALSLSMAIPFLVNQQTNTDKNNVTRCFEGYHNETDEEKQKVAAMHFIIISAFFVVFFLVVVCNCLTAQALLTQTPPPSGLSSVKTLSRHSQAPRGVKRRALQMLLAVVGVFVLCFLPHHIVQGPWTLAVLRIKQGWGHVDWEPVTLQMLNDAHQVTLVFMGLNCILDPWVYFFSTRKFRRFIKAHIRRIGKGEACTQTTTSQLSMDSKAHSVRLKVDLEQPDMH